MPIDFSEFPPISKAAWLQQVAKDLKEKSLEDFQWQVGPGMAVTPFLHAEDFPHPAQPLQTAPLHWEICEQVETGDPEVANRQILEALEFGAEGLELDWPVPVDPAQLGRVLNGVYLDFVGLHFTGPGVVQNPGAVLAGLQRLAAERQLAPAQLHGSLAYDPVTQATLVDWRYLVDLIAFARPAFPGFRLIRIAAQAHLPEDPVQKLTQLLRQGHGYLQKLTERGVPVGDAVSVMQFFLPVGKSYFLEIAKIRAFKTLWLNVLRGWEAPLEHPRVVAHFTPEAYGDDLHTNMVRATTMAMSAVLGGADRLTVLPYDAGRETQAAYPPSFSRRIARNVQHLLKMESGLDQVIDPAAGSYYLENLTGQLMQLAWSEFTRPTP